MKAGQEFYINRAVALSLMALFSYFEPATFFYLRYLSFNKGQRGWQFACRAVLAPYEFTAVRVSCLYSYNAEKALFSNRARRDWEPDNGVYAAREAGVP